jgi:hypothetical protein
MILSGLREVRRPDRSGLIQLHCKFFDPYLGEGSWAYYEYPNVLFESDDWTEFEAWCHKHIKLSRELIDKLLVMMTNFEVVNYDLKSGVLDNYMSGVLSGKPSFWSVDNPTPRPSQ